MENPVYCEAQIQLTVAREGKVHAVYVHHVLKLDLKWFSNLKW